MINWVTLIIVFLGGLALFLYGMELMSDGLIKASGSRIRQILNVFTRNRFASFLTGTLTTTVVQSSSAVSVMSISLVESGLLKYRQTFGILLGAGIGTTITAQIIAFKLSDYSLLIVALGFFMKLLSNRAVLKFTGSALLGFGLLFYGLEVMSDAMLPLRSQANLINALLKLETPVLGILAGLIFTAIIQSSSAFIGILIVLATQGLLSLEAAVPLLLGANIGTTATAILASLKSGYESKRVAVTFFFIKLFGVLLILPWIPGYTHLVDKLSIYISGNEIELSRKIANAHTLFNIGVSIILLPFANTITGLIIKLMPSRVVVEEQPIDLKYVKKKMIDQPALALSLAKKETFEMAAHVRNMLEFIITPFIAKDKTNLDKIEELEKITDYYQKNISAYVMQISQQKVSEDLIDESFKINYIVTELEEIADVVYNALLDQALLWVNSTKEFSDEGKVELSKYHEQILGHYDSALHVFNQYNPKLASKLKKENKLLRNMSIELKQKHFLRLSHNIPESVSTTRTHMEIIGNLRAIHGHISNISRLLYQ